MQWQVAGDEMAPQDPLEEVVTMIYRIKGSDLQLYRTGKIDRDEVRKRVLPLTVRAVVASDTPLVPWMAERPTRRGAATAYLCEAMTCQLPTTDPKELAALLDDQPKPEAPLRDHAPELPASADAWINSPPMSLADLRGNVVVLDAIESRRRGALAL